MKIKIVPISAGKWLQIFTSSKQKDTVHFDVVGFEKTA